MIILFIMFNVLLLLLDGILLFKKEETSNNDHLEELVDTKIKLDKKRAILDLLVNKKVSIYELYYSNNIEEYNRAIDYVLDEDRLWDTRRETRLEFYALEEDDFIFLKEHLLGQEVNDDKDNQEG